jgi:hypothetical protein
MFSSAKEHEWFGRFTNDCNEPQMIWLCAIINIERAWMIVNNCEHWMNISDYEWLWTFMCDCEQLWMTMSECECLWTWMTMSKYEHQMNMTNCKIIEQSLWMVCECEQRVICEREQGMICEWEQGTICEWMRGVICEWVQGTIWKQGAICEWKIYDWWTSKKNLCIFCEINSVHFMSDNVSSFVSPNQF